GQPADPQPPGRADRQDPALLHDRHEEDRLIDPLAPGPRAGSPSSRTTPTRPRLVIRIQIVCFITIRCLPRPGALPTIFSPTTRGTSHALRHDACSQARYSTRAGHTALVPDSRVRHRLQRLFGDHPAG